MPTEIGEELKPLTVMFRDESGREWILPARIQTVEIAEETYGEKFLEALLGYDMEFTTTYTIRARHWKGQFDFLFGRKTKTAMRYVRSMKRLNEKKRRKELKGGITR